MKATLSILCAGLAFSWVATAGAQQPQQSQYRVAIQGQSGQSGSEQGSGQSGQSGQSGSTYDQSGSGKHSGSSREVKLTGCLMQGSTPDTYVLNNVENESSGKSSSGSYGSGSGSSAAGTSGQSGSTSGQSGSMSGESQGEQTGMNFELVPSGSKVNLSKYVGKRVEVRGTVEPAGMGMGGSSMSGTSGSGTGEASGMSGSQSGSQSGSGTQSGQSGSMSGQSGSMSGQGSAAGNPTHRVMVRSVKQLGSSCK